MISKLLGFRGMLWALNLVYWGNIGIMENQMETIGILGIIWGLYRGIVSFISCFAERRACLNLQPLVSVAFDPRLHAQVVVS